MNELPYILALDTSNEVIALGLGVLRPSGDATNELPAIERVASLSIPAHRASNTRLLPEVEALLEREGVPRDAIACVACGRGPGSFTGVRIACATAKGLASALEVPLVGVSTLDAIAWRLQEAGLRGRALVVADAMRHEVYPVRFELSDDGVERLEPDTVEKVESCAERLAGEGLTVAGDALAKYAELFEPVGPFAPSELWTADGAGLLAAVRAAWRAGACDPLDTQRHDPALLLPVYTRLSDAEENERKKLAGEPNAAGAPEKVGGALPGKSSDGAADKPPESGVAGAYTLRPLDAAHAVDVAALEARVMGSDAWNEALVADELPRRDRTWWAAYESATGALAGYAGGWVVDGQLQVLKVGVAPEHRRRGLARELLARIAEDARDLGARECTLEVRVGNEGAIALYEALGLARIGVRPHYYSDREDALIMTGPLPVCARDVAGMELRVGEAARDAGAAWHGAGRNENQALGTPKEVSGGEAGERSWPAATPRLALGQGQGAQGPDVPPDSAQASARPLFGRTAEPVILAIESSCDETAAAIVDGQGRILADVVASQIDFHARFGGVVPEIASRKHTEAICGVVQTCLEQAAARLGVERLGLRDLSAVAATYAPGLVGALVVGVAFAKAAAFGAGVPFIRVNHLEGHLYANKIEAPDLRPPLVASLVSGGNTMLVHVRDWGDYRVLGATIDDAVGEAFDKVAKALGLGYPGGPAVSRLAAQGNPKAIAFPRAMLHSGDLRFSLSGLKTAVVSHIAKERAAGRELNLPDVCASFQAAVVDVQVAKARTALQETGAPTFCLGGGVAANPALRAAYERMCKREGVRLVVPPLSACGDNAAMIALVALERYQQGTFSGLETDCAAHANLEEPY